MGQISWFLRKIEKKGKEGGKGKEEWEEGRRKKKSKLLKTEAWVGV